jgi:hypothetical protein
MCLNENFNTTRELKEILVDLVKTWLICRFILLIHFSDMLDIIRSYFFWGLSKYGDNTIVNTKRIFIEGIIKKLIDEEKIYVILAMLKKKKDWLDPKEFYNLDPSLFYNFFLKKRKNNTDKC